MIHRTPGHWSDVRKTWCAPLGGSVMKTPSGNRFQGALILGLLLCSLSQALGQNGPKPTTKETAAKDQETPIILTAFGNRLIVTSEDRAALALVSELVRLLTSNTTAPGDFQIIRLKRANAVDTAKLLDEAFNGAKPTPGF